MSVLQHLDQAGSWLSNNSVEPNYTTVARESDSQKTIWLTSPELIDRIVRAIELDQSVLLSGPRGCGKSYCIRQAIKEAQRRGILTLDSHIECQGNREVPRDYLMEDDVVFRVQVPSGKHHESDQEVSGKPIQTENKVVPSMRSAPIFEYAERDEENDPIVWNRSTSEVRCSIKRGKLKRRVKKYSLFLDEINRFSDGVLDSLLSVLEEKVAFLRGKAYRLPVVVLMTMNPPGYDATARNLSPPLAARISRSYQLYTPDIDTLTDLIIKEKLDGLEVHLNSDHQDASLHQIKRLDSAKRFVDISPRLRRRAALTTLLLWGNPGERLEHTKPGIEYLTDDTKVLIQACTARDKDLGRKLIELSGLCRFGPDGRAAADWLTSASARAIQHAEDESYILVSEDDCIETAIESLSHKIYDDFSPASEPKKVVQKEAIIKSIVKKVMGRDFDDLIVRTIDDPSFLTKFTGLVRQTGELNKIFTDSRLTGDGFVVPISDMLLKVCRPLVLKSQEQDIEKAKSELRHALSKLSLYSIDGKQELREQSSDEVRNDWAAVPIFSKSVEGTSWPDRFCDVRWDRLFRSLSKLDGPLPQAIRSLSASSSRRDLTFGLI